MSQPSKSISEQVEEFDLSLDTLREVYHVPVLAALFAFMLWVRTRGWENFVNGNEILFSGNDAYYHYRMVQYSVNNWPSTMPFDPWTSFPTGTSVGQFGTLFDQLIATGALVYGLGSPTVFQTKLVTLFAPAIFGALAIIPTFYIGKRLGGKAGGLIAALILALTPGQFLTRSVVGFADHHVGETLFMALAVVFIMAALAVAKRDRPIWELFTARDFDALRPTLLWSALAGVGIGLYVWVWPPGVFLAGIVAVFLVLYLLASVASGGVADHVGIPGAVMMTAATVMVLIPLDTFSFSATRFSIAQPFVTAGGALACVIIVFGARFWERQESLPRLGFPAALVLGGLAVVGLVAVALPDVFGFFLNQLTRVAGLGATATARTVAEATPVQDPGNFVYTAYGLAFYTAVAGLVLLAYRTVRADPIDPIGTFVIVWTLFLLAATFTQRRFDYYFILAVAGLNAFLAKEVFELLGLYDLAGSVREIEGYQVLSIVAVLLIITAPLAVRTGQGGMNNVIDQAEGQTASPGEVANWESGLTWLDNETPQEGQWGSNPETSLGEGEYGTYQRTDNFDYASGDYGVLAWWDYGHWITVLGDRVPNANPFQQNADYAANVLLSTNESYAYEQMRRTQGEDEQTRYVMLDYQMGLAGTRKFSAPAAWETRYTVDNATGEGYAGEPPANASVHDLRPGDLSTNVFVAQQVQGQLRPVSRYAVQSQRSMESFRTRLYQYHGSRAEPTFRDGSVVVADWETEQFRGRNLRVATAETQLVRTFPNMTAAEEYVQQDPTSQIGGVLGKPSEPVPAMEHYRLVWASQRSSPTPVSRAFSIQQRLRGQQAGSIETQPYLKTFERVPGATVTGEATPNTTVTAAVRMRIPTNGRTFTYQQQAETGPDGEFTMTLPYSTTGYEEWGPEEGHTNVSVRATGPYSFTTPRTVNQSTLAVEQYTGSVNVTEAQVIGEDDGTVEVTMRKLTINEPEGANDGGTNETQDGTDTSGDTNDTSSTPTPTPTGESTPTPTPTDGGASTPTPTPSQSLAPLATVAEHAGFDAGGLPTFTGVTG